MLGKQRTEDHPLLGTREQLASRVAVVRVLIESVGGASRVYRFLSRRVASVAAASASVATAARRDSATAAPTTASCRAQWGGRRVLAFVLIVLGRFLHVRCIRLLVRACVSAHVR